MTVRHRSRHRAPSVLRAVLVPRPQARSAAPTRHARTSSAPEPTGAADGISLSHPTIPTRCAGIARLRRRRGWLSRDGPLWGVVRMRSCHQFAHCRAPMSMRQCKVADWGRCRYENARTGQLRSAALPSRKGPAGHGRTGGLPVVSREPIKDPRAHGTSAGLETLWHWS